ncbi:choline transporter-like protein 4 isoform X2 [Nycticebus coucang]|uniref:choline transporter-like protein 4 isoform X2 n=1 Tax=Nycticebus coucang TaxID=9470 RepID=UPI00234E0826|nr:choline transporter-like protein 4 isoform X2 [Nycticebus coucang]
MAYSAPHPRCVCPPAQKPHGPWQRTSSGKQLARSSILKIQTFVCQGCPGICKCSKAYNRNSAPVSSSPLLQLWDAAFHGPMLLPPNFQGLQATSPRASVVLSTASMPETSVLRSLKILPNPGTGFLSGPLVLVLILGVLGVLAYGIYYCWEEYRVLRDKGASISQLGFTTNLSAYQRVQETWLAALIVLAVLEGILLLMLIFLRQRIRIAIALLTEASKAVGHMMSTMFYPLVTFALLLICIAYWAVTALYLATSGQPQYVLWAPNASSPSCEKVPMNTSCDPMAQPVNSSCPGLMCVFQGYLSTGPAQRSLFNLQIYAVVGLFWTLNWVLALGQCVLAGAFASFYWAFHKPRDIPTFPLSSAFVRTLRYHTGSLAFGALILTLVQIARVILEYIDHKLRGLQNPIARCIMCCFKCCLWCLEKFIKFLNRNAYIMIAIYGKNFCVSAKNAFMLLMRNIVRVVVLDKVTDLLLFFGKLLVVGGVGVLSFFFFSGRIQGLSKAFENPHLNYYWLPIMTSILGAYVIASGFFSVFGMCVDTLFLCFLEDLERNDGSLDRPYYMPKALLKILGKKNEVPQANKKRKK